MTQPVDTPLLLEWGAPLAAHPLPHVVYDPGSRHLLAANAAALARLGFAPDTLPRRLLADLPLPLTQGLPIRIAGRMAYLAVWAPDGNETHSMKPFGAGLEERFRAMTDAAPVGIFMTDADGGCTYANAAWLQLYGLRAEQALGQGWVGVVHPEDRDAVHRHWLACAAARRSFELEFRLQLADGTERRVAARSNPIVRADGGVSGHVGTVVDMTQARELEVARRAQAVAEEAGRRQAAFMSRVSHELRTPLNAILGFGQLLQQGGPALPAVRSQAFAGHVVQAGQHMLALVDDLLELQRLEQGRVALNRQPVQLHTLLKSCADLLAPAAAAAEVDLLVAGDPALLVHSDERCLRQLLLNLGSNAVKYGRPAQGRGRVVLAAERMGQQVRLHVSDSGMGIAPEQLQRLFQPFERLGQEGGATPGSGLGLVISRHLAQLLGGEVSLDSRPGRGTTATVQLPA